MKLFENILRNIFVLCRIFKDKIKKNIGRENFMLEFYRKFCGIVFK